MGTDEEEHLAWSAGEGEVSMGDPVKLRSDQGRSLVTRLAEDLPVLVEVRFQRSGTSSDWYLCRTDKKLNELLKRATAFAPGTQLCFKSVDDLDQST